MDLEAEWRRDDESFDGMRGAASDGINATDVDNPVLGAASDNDAPGGNTGVDEEATPSFEGSMSNGTVAPSSSEDSTESPANESSSFSSSFSSSSSPSLTAAPPTTLIPEGRKRKQASFLSIFHGRRTFFV